MRSFLDPETFDRFQLDMKQFLVISELKYIRVSPKLQFTS